jgi:hypothetical protein
VSGIFDPGLMEDDEIMWYIDKVFPSNSQPIKIVFHKLFSNNEVESKVPVPTYFKAYY